MSDYIAAPAAYNQGFLAGYTDATTFHRTVDTTAGETDDNGLSRGYTDGYLAGYSAGETAGEGNIHRWMVHASSDQTLTQGAYTKANFNSSDDVHGVSYSSGNKRITINQTGYYWVIGGGCISRSGASSVAGAYFRWTIRRNGSNQRHGDSECESTLENSVMGFVRERVYCTAGQYLEIFIYYNTGGGTIKLDAVSPDSTDASFAGYLDI